MGRTDKAEPMGLFSKPKKPEYPPNEVFPAIDRDRIAKDLDVAATGARNGRNDMPESGRTDIDVTENAVVSKIEEIRRDGLSRFSEQVRVYRERIGRIEIIGPGIRQAADMAEINFQREIAASRERLEGRRKHFNEIRSERNRFQERNRLDRAEHPYKGGWKWVLITVLIVVIESALNGVFFSATHVKGLAGGTSVALVISIVNIGAATIAGHLFRNVNHIHIGRKIIGALAFIFGVFFAVFGNFLVGHFRDAAGESPLERTPGIVFDRLASGQYLMESLDAWLLAALGMLIAAFAGWKAYTMTDPYPGYGSVGQKFVDAQEELHDLHEEILQILTDTRDSATRELNRNWDDAQTVINNAVSAYENLTDLHGRRVSFLRECDTAVNHLLTMYREANRQARETPAPVYFSETFRFQSEPDLEPPGQPDAEAMQQFRDTVDEAVERIREKCSNAILSFDSGDATTGGAS